MTDWSRSGLPLGCLPACNNNQSITPIDEAEQTSNYLPCSGNCRSYLPHQWAALVPAIPSGELRNRLHSDVSAICLPTDAHGNILLAHSQWTNGEDFLL